MTEQLPLTSVSTDATPVIEVRAVRPEEWEAAGAATAAAYQEFYTGDADPHRSNYLERIADVAQRAPRTLVLVALLDGRVAGSSTLELTGRVEPDSPPPAPGSAHVRMVGVAPTERRRGIARALMVASIQAARDAGCHTLTLNTTEFMTGAQRLYESLGFVRGADLPFGEDFVLLSYALDLSASA